MEFADFKKEIKTTYAGKRVVVVSGKIPEVLYSRVREVMKVRNYKSMNDFIEEVILDKIARIEWAKVKREGVKNGN